MIFFLQNYSCEHKNLYFINLCSINITDCIPIDLDFVIIEMYRYVH